MPINATAVRCNDDRAISVRRAGSLARIGLAFLFVLLSALGTPRLAQAQPENTGEARAEGAVADAPPESFLRQGARASGPIGVIILLMSFYLFAVIVWMLVYYRRSIAIPAGLVGELNDLIAQKRFTDAYTRLTADGAFLAQVLAAGVRRLPAGYPAAQRAMEQVNQDVTMAMEHRTTYLSTVGTLGPMIGLLGTVYGMIQSFRVMASAGSTPQASQLAEGISIALFATLEGIAISVPAIAFYAFFRNRISRLSLEVELTAESLLEQFAPGVRSPHPLAAAAAQQPRPPLGAPAKPE